MLPEKENHMECIGRNKIHVGNKKPQRNWIEEAK